MYDDIVQAPNGNAVRRDLSSAIARERSAIDQESSRTGAVADGLHIAISELEEALNPVTAPRAEKIDTDPSREPQGNSPLYFRISQTNSTLEDAVSRIYSLRRSLEV